MEPRLFGEGDRYNEAVAVVGLLDSRIATYRAKGPCGDVVQKMFDYCVSSRSKQTNVGRVSRLAGGGPVRSHDGGVERNRWLRGGLERAWQTCAAVDKSSFR